jgi:molecular chaperone DnaK (HSP70)
VFDFGGGTCDVAIFSIEFPTFSERPRISPLSVSRYHRLGGGDIDVAIVYDVLLPELYRQNQIGEFEFGWDIKKRIFEPALRNTAEALKINLCDEINRLVAFNRYEKADLESIYVRLPVVIRIKVANRELVLNSAQLNAKQFSQILEPFLDKYVTLHRETEYKTTCSIFAPLGDALYRAGLKPRQVDYCLAVGGSTLIPQVRQALKEYFANGKVLTYDNADDTQTAVARGAAYHALSLALFGKGLLQPICFDPICIMTQKGLMELIKGNTTLPTEGHQDFTVPESSLAEPLELKIEIHAGEEGQQRMIERKTVQINDFVNQGDKIFLEYRMDENQVLYLRMRIENLQEQVFEFTFENPLTNVVNPQPVRMEIDRIEEDMRVGKIARESQPEAFVELAKKYQELGQRDKAMTCLQQALTGVGTPDPYILNLMGILAGEIGDKDGEIKLYRQAAKEADDGGPLFNAALALEKRGLIKEAIREIEAAIEREPEPAYYTLRAILAEKENDLGGRKRFLEKAKEGFGPISTMTEWELGWYLRTMRMLEDIEGIKSGEEELEQRKRVHPMIADAPGHYPVPSILPARK